MTTTQRLTLATFLALPEQKPALEFHDGTITSKMAPTTPHAMAAMRLIGLLSPHGFPLPEIRVTLGDTSYVPDIGFYVGQPEAPYPLRAPELAIEIVSPGQPLDELRDKCRWYVAHGSEQALLVDPERRVIEVFGPQGAYSQHQRGPLPLTTGLTIRAEQVLGRE